jgi:hypothetical protein
MYTEGKWYIAGARGRESLAFLLLTHIAGFKNFMHKAIFKETTFYVKIRLLWNVK